MISKLCTELHGTISFLPQRVLNSTLFESIQQLRNTIIKLNDSSRFVKNQPDLSVDSINRAMGNMLHVIKYDIGIIKNLVVKIKETFESEFGDSIKPTMSQAQNFHDALSYLVVNIDHAHNNDVQYNSQNNTAIIFDPKYLFHVRNMIVTLKAHLIAFYNTVVKRIMFKVGENVHKYMPMRLWLMSNSSFNCELVIRNEIEEFTALIELIEDTLRDWGELRGTNSSDRQRPHALINGVRMRHTNVRVTISCISELHMIIENGHGVVSRLHREVDDALINNALYNTLSFHEALKSELDNINSQIELLQDLLIRYSRNSSSMLDVVDEILKNNIHESLKTTTETMLSKMDLDTVMKLQIESQSIKNNAQKWIQSALNITNKLAKYYENEFIETEMRSLKIWKKPIPVLGVPELLQYKYEDSETWRTWSFSLKLNQFVSMEASTEISGILNYYFDKLYKKINWIRRHMLNAFREALAEISRLEEKMVAYKQKSELNDDYIR